MPKMTMAAISGLAMVALLAAFCDALRADPIVDLVRNAPRAEAYPEADALVLLRSTAVTINRDGSREAIEHRVVKILSERGKEEYSELHER
ncbi:MAG: hypothetical protein QME74_09825, partial [Candidatus Edwardsbacteria bacterium]|nr:hypothetical protein [Candidatus Edwardsbacteria bacterium]